MHASCMVLIALLCIAAGGHAGAAVPEPVRLKTGEGVLPVLSHAAVAHDPSCGLDIEDILSVDRGLVFEPVEEVVPAFGYKPCAVWMRVDLENPQPEYVVAMLELPLARLCRIDWFIIHEGRVLKETADGIKSRSRDPARTRFPALTVRVPPGGMRTVFLRVESATAIYLPLKAFSLIDYAHHTARRDFVDYGFIGFGTAMFLLAFFNGLFWKRRLYLLLSLLVAFLMGYYLIFQGYYQWLGGPFPVWVNRSFMLALGMAANWTFYYFSASSA